MSECTNPDIGQMIGRYEFGLLSPDEKAQFEVHMLKCDACFQEHHSFSPAVKTMRHHVKLFRKVVQEEKAGYKLFRFFIPYKTMRWAISAAAVILLTVIGIQIKQLFVSPASSDKIVISQDKPELLSPYDPETRSLKGDMEITQSEMEKSLIASMKVLMDKRTKKLHFIWAVIPDVQSYTLILIDPVNQDTLFISTGITGTGIEFSLEKIKSDHRYEWQLSGVTDGEQIVRVSKEISFQ